MGVFIFTGSTLMIDQIEEVRAALILARQNPATKRKFLTETWDAVIQLAQTHSHQELCQRLQLDPALLKRKIEQRRPSIEFHELSLQNISSERITIELISKKGMRAKIEGPLSCLNCLPQLMGV